MFRIAIALLSVMTAVPMFSQVDPSTAVDLTAPDQETRMITPPVVGGAILPMDSEVGQRSNYLNGGVTFNWAYISNVQPGASSGAINDQSYSIWPILSLDQRTPRSTRLLTYSSGFTFYKQTSALDSINQNMDARFDYGFSPRFTMSLRDSLRQNSNVFNQPLDSGGTNSPPGGTQSPGVVIPFEEELKNDINAIFSYQFDQFSMFGGKVGFGTLNFPNLTKGSGLYNSRAETELGFYSWRVSNAQYFGAMYQGANVVTTGQTTTTQTQTPSFFYTFYSDRGITLTLAGGPQYMKFTEPGSPSYEEWTPSVKAIFSWQTPRIRIASDYSKEITAGQGILGAYSSNSADTSLRFQLGRNWLFNSIVVYQNDKNSVPAFQQGYPGGHSLSWTVSAGYNIREYLVAGLGYTRLHQSYSGITEIALTPNSDRVYFSLSYYFHRPLGR